MTPLFIGGLGMSEVLLIALVVLLFFGGKKIPPRRFYSPKRKEYVVSKGVKKISFVPSQKNSETISNLK